MSAVYTAHGLKQKSVIQVSPIVQPQYNPWRAKPSRMPRAISASVSTTLLFWGCLANQSTRVGCALPTTMAGLAPAHK